MALSWFFIPIGLLCVALVILMVVGWNLEQRTNPGCLQCAFTGEVMPDSIPEEMVCRTGKTKWDIAHGQVPIFESYKVLNKHGKCPSFKQRGWT